MAATTKIEWATATWNPWIGCTKVSEACRYCYAERDQAGRRKRVVWGQHGTRSRTSPAYWRQLLTWNERAECLRTFDCATGDHADCCPQSRSNRPRVFVGSLCDLFEDWDGPILAHGKDPVFLGRGGRASTGPADRMRLDDLRAELWPLICQFQNLDFLLLTKRPQNARLMIPGEWFDSWPPNCWIGTTVEDQAAANSRIPHLLELPAPVRFLSCEPLLAPLNLRQLLPARLAVLQCQQCQAFHNTLQDCSWCGADCSELSGQHAANVRDPQDAGRWTNWQPIDWIICGGESGPEARISHPAWFRELRDVALASGVPFLFKQWGEWAPCSPDQWHGLGPNALPRQLVVSPSGRDSCSGFLSKTASAQAKADGWLPMQRIGKAAAGNELDGRKWLEIPRPMDRRLVLPAGKAAAE